MGWWRNERGKREVGRGKGRSRAPFLLILDRLTTRIKFELGRQRRRGTMGRIILGVVLASVAMFFWGFLYWGINPLPYQTWKKAPNDEAVQSALMATLPESGIYHVPT